MQGPRLKKIVLCLAATLPMVVNAYEPSVTALGMGGVYTSGWIDGLMPLYRDNQQLVYSDLQFEGNSTNAGILSVGGGYRQQINSQGIAGAYVFYDHERSASKYYYNVISPGVEYLTSSWQYRFNYYAPFGTKTYLISQGLAEDFGNTQYESFSGNTLTDSTQYNYESLSYGADFAVGYRFQTDKRWQVNLTPYVFNQTDNNTMMGANAQLNFYTNDNTIVFLGDGYDNVNHNRIFVGVSFTFGGHNNDNSVDNLMQSPVYRNLDVNTTSTGLPTSEYAQFSAPMQQPGFFAFVNDSTTGSTEVGTYENPYTNIDQISGAPDDAQIRVASTGTNYTSNEMTLSGTQTMAGYTDDYKLLATGNDRPVIQSDAGVILSGDNSMTSLQILSHGAPTAAGVTINGNATLNNVSIGSQENDTRFQTGVQLTNGASGTINNSTVTGYASDGVGSVYGVDSNNATLEINNSSINSISTVSSGTPLNFGINQLGGTLSFNNSTLNCSSNFGNSHALYLNNVGDVSVTNSTITGSSINGNASAVYILSETGNVIINNSTLNATSTKSGGHAYGLYSSNNEGDITVNNAQINVQAETTAIGLNIDSGTGSTTLTDSEMTVTGTGGSSSATGVQSTAIGIVTITNNTINLAGTTQNGIVNTGGTLIDENNTINSG